MIRYNIDFGLAGYAQEDSAGYWVKYSEADELADTLRWTQHQLSRTNIQWRDMYHQLEAENSNLKLRLVACGVEP